MTEETASSGDEPVGSLSQEAIKLIHAMSANSDSAEQHVCTNAWCPACQIANYVRDHPDVVENVAQSAVVFAESIRDLFEHVTTRKDEM